MNDEIYLKSSVKRYPYELMRLEVLAIRCGEDSKGSKAECQKICFNTIRPVPRLNSFIIWKAP